MLLPFDHSSFWQNCLHSTKCQELVQKFTAAMNSIVENFEEEGTAIKWGNLSEPLRAQVGETKITEGLLISRHAISPG